MLLPTNVIISTWIITSLPIDPVKGIEEDNSEKWGYLFF